MARHQHPTERARAGVLRRGTGRLYAHTRTDEAETEGRNRGGSEFSIELTELLNLFADYDVCQAQPILPLNRLRSVIEERLGGLELQRFADLLMFDQGPLDLLRLSRDHDGRAAFDAHRERSR